MTRSEPHHPPAPSSKEEGENHAVAQRTPSSSEEGVGGGGRPSRHMMLRRAAALRQRLPEPERHLWMALRDRRFQGYKFRRKPVIGSRIVDFFCPSKGLIVEVDGGTHRSEEARG